jgi:CheY-like chemotaxis protein
MNKTILVADDSKTMRKLVSLALEATGLNVVVVESGEAALAHFGQVTPALVIADSKMPGLDGMELARALRSRDDGARVPVMLLAGEHETVDGSAAERLGIAGVLRKPFESGAFLQRVREAVEPPVEAAIAVPAPEPTAAPEPIAVSERVAMPAPAPMAPFAQPLSQPAPFAQPLGQPAPFAQPLGQLPPFPASAAPSPQPAVPTTRDAIAVAPASPFGAPRAELAAPSPSSGSATAGAALALGHDRPLPAAEDLAPSLASPAIDDFGLEVPIDESEEESARASIASGPTLEPPTPPSERGERAAVDVWALAEGGEVAEPRASLDEIPIEDAVFDEGAASDAFVPSAQPSLAAASSGASSPAPSVLEAPTQDIPEPEGLGISALTPEAAPPPAAPVSAAVSALVEKTAPLLAEAARPAAPGLGHDELVKIARDVIERVAWEVVPELAELIIRAELDRLLREERG